MNLESTRRQSNRRTIGLVILYAGCLAAFALAWWIT
jgi:hypothetical protein